jgi:thiamine kinase-like enzyme
LARINFFPGKNDWKVKRGEFETLKEIEHLSISPKAYVLNEDNDLNQDLIIVEYIEGENIIKFSESDIVFLAKDLKKLHTFAKKYDNAQALPYTCSIYNEFANGEDKKIENYNFQDIVQVFSKYNSIKEDLGKWFNSLSIFDNCENLCLCHGDLKSENILKTEKGIILIDWECADIDIPETDIGRLFS